MNSSLIDARRLRRVIVLALLAVGAYSTLGVANADDKASAKPQVEWQCPAGYEVKAGLNTDFPHKGLKRAFVVYPPDDAPGNTQRPAPVWVPLTGTVESTNDNLTVERSGANAELAHHGYMVIGPVRVCSEQDPNARTQ